MTVYTRADLPMTTLARQEIERDSGGHLIGTMYPGEPVNMDQFEVPDKRWSVDMMCRVEMALLWLYVMKGHEVFNTFCCGEATEQETIIAKNRDAVRALRVPGDLEMAHKFLDDYFNRWED